MKRIALVCIGFCLLWLAGCATLPSAIKPVNQEMTWAQRQAELAAFTHFRLEGAIAITRRNKAFQANVIWQAQGQKHFSLSLFGPMGAGRTTIVGKPEQVTMTNADGKFLMAATAEDLLQSQLGWYLPVSNVFYWVRGIPVPGMTADKTFDTFHHLTELKQDGWTIQYERYTSTAGKDLPSKLKLSHGDIRVKWVIGEWK